jgi:transposase-like protein
MHRTVAEQQPGRTIEAEPRPVREAPVRPPSAGEKLGDVRTVELLERYASGASAQAVGREFGISAAAVMWLVRRHGFSVNDRKPSADVVARGAELYRSGLSVQRVANELGVNKSTMLRELKRAGVDMREQTRS